MRIQESLARLTYASVCLLLAGCGDPAAPLSDFTVLEHVSDTQSPVRPCTHYSATKKAYFGDLHVHTALSNDAYSYGSRATPDDAYRYAFGHGAISLPVNRGDTELTRSVSIDRPLDFMAVTDHAEFLGEQTLCQNPELAKTAEFCDAFEEGEGRNPKLLAKIFSPFPARDDEVCGENGERCKNAAITPWREAIAAAEAWNDVSDACERSTFVAFEYSSVRLGSNLHRNVIFRSTRVPQRPISYLDAPREWRLWEILDKNCLGDKSGCDVLAIPHNSNISNGRMFAVDYAGARSKAAQVERVELRRRIEPVVEIMQHKGDSECRNGITGVLGGEDELCDFEKFENLAFKAVAGTEDIDDCYTGPFADYVPHKGPNCLSRNSYVRYALIEGMKEQERIGVNPFQLGIMASTDTHNAMAGGVLEQRFAGHLGWGDGTAERRVTYKTEVPGNTSNNPGGLIGVWSEQNSRESLFDNIRAKEVFGTSGPRIQPRFFAGSDFSSKLCSDASMLDYAYANGVPMGGELDASSSSPMFLASALADSGTTAYPGTPLQRLQMIKGWYDEDGNHHQKVHDIAGDPDNQARVDPETCEPQGAGFDQLCAVWQDPDFKPGQRAVYYLRAVENPSCRYSARQCLTFSADQRPADCDNDSVAKTIQERAWSSPIWYSPET